MPSCKPPRVANHFITSFQQINSLTAKEDMATQKPCKHHLKASSESDTSRETGVLRPASDFIIQVQLLLHKEQMKGSLTASFFGVRKCGGWYGSGEGNGGL